MATFNVSKKNKKQRNTEKTKKIVGSSLLGVASVLFLFSVTSLWPWAQSAILGIFGIFVYPLCIVTMVIGLALLNNRKYVMSKRYAIFLSLSIIFLIALIQLMIVGNKYGADGQAYNYWEYLGLNFTKKWTAGGILIGLLTTSLLLPLNLAGAYIVLSLGLLISVAFFIEALISYHKNAEINSPVKIQISSKKKNKHPDVAREEAMKPKEEINVVMNGEIADTLSREQIAKRKYGLAGTMSTDSIYNQDANYEQYQSQDKGGVPEGTSVKEFLLEPPKVDMEEFFARQQRMSRSHLNNQKRQITDYNLDKEEIDNAFEDLKENEPIKPTEHIFEQQFDFSANTSSIKRRNLPEIQPEELLSEADKIIFEATQEELKDISADNDDFIIRKDSPKIEETQVKPEINTNFTTRTDGYLRDTTGFSRDRSDGEIMARNRNLENLSALTDRSQSRETLGDKRDNLGRGQDFSRNNLNNDRSRSFDRANAIKKEIQSENTQERFKPYKYSKPAIELITTQSDDLSILNDEVPAKRVALENALEQFGVPAKVQGVVIGPTVTRYEIAMPEGISVKKILSLDADIAYALSAKGQIRIEAPVPGRSIVGIEVPNNKVAKVSIKDVLQSKEYTMSPSPLCFALGKDITGTVKVCNLAKMPHLLVAGTTGSGKSVCLNSIIVSMIYKASPDDVKFIMIDPKQVELSMYEGLPHMVVPKVITDATRAVNALQWAVDEMERRFNLLSEVRVRDINEYNKTEDVQSGKKKKIPYLVIIFDEFADFMLVAKNEIEDKIMRLAQKARAAGIHLILATQRPSTDVVTGTIKANFPARIAFKVAGRVDSEVIMGATGAEKLLGYGDMLYKPSDSAPARIQGCFIDTPETKDVVNFIIENNEETYDEEAFNAINNPGKPNGKGGDGADFDPLLPQALKICIDVGVASTTMIQRKLSVGYPKAARLIDQMEQRGYISSADGAKQRTVYTSIEEFYQIFGDTYE